MLTFVYSDGCLELFWVQLHALDTFPIYKESVILRSLSQSILKCQMNNLKEITCFSDFEL